MRLNITAIKSIILPVLFILPLMGAIACSSDEINQATNDTFDTLGESIADLPENVEVAAPIIKKDLQALWADVSDQMVVYAEGMGVSEPPHPLAEAEEAREKLIAGASFREVVANAYANLTREDLESVESSELNQLNGILPFEIDVTQCGETLAEVLNSLDIGQVSSILRTPEGFHLIKLIDRNGARVKIGHLVFQIDPQAESETDDYDIVVSSDEERPEGMDEAIAKLNRVLEENWR